jgi:ribosomal protein L15E
LRLPDLNLSIDGVQLIPSTADLIIVRNAHRRRSKPPIVRLCCPSFDESAKSLAFDCQQTIEIAPQRCWRTRHESNL